MSKDNNRFIFLKNILKNAAERDAKQLKGINMRALKSEFPPDSAMYDESLDPNERRNSIKEYYSMLSDMAVKGPYFTEDAIKYVEEHVTNELIPNYRKQFVKWLGRALSTADKSDFPEPNDLSMIKDWFVSQGWPDSEDINDDEISLSYAKLESRAWHDSLSDIPNDIYENDGIEIAKKVVFRAGDITIVYEPEVSEDPIARKKLGRQLGLCLAQGLYATDREGLIYSLRDARNNPHACIRVLQNGSVAEMKGKQNTASTISVKYAEVLKKWVKREGYRVENCSDYKQLPPTTWGEAKNVCESNRTTFFRRGYYRQYRKEFYPILEDYLNTNFREERFLELESDAFGGSSLHRLKNEIRAALNGGLQHTYGALISKHLRAISVLNPVAYLEANLPKTYSGSMYSETHRGAISELAKHSPYVLFNATRPSASKRRRRFTLSKDLMGWAVQKEAEVIANLEKESGRMVAVYDYQTKLYEEAMRSVENNNTDHDRFALMASPQFMYGWVDDVSPDKILGHSHDLQRGERLRKDVRDIKDKMDYIGALISVANYNPKILKKYRKELEEIIKNYMYLKNKSKEDIAKIDGGAEYAPEFVSYVHSTTEYANPAIGIVKSRLYRGSDVYKDVVNQKVEGILSMLNENLPPGAGQMNYEDEVASFFDMGLHTSKEYAHMTEKVIRFHLEKIYNRYSDDHLLRYVKMARVSNELKIDIAKHLLKLEDGVSIYFRRADFYKNPLFHDITSEAVKLIPFMRVYILESLGEGNTDLNRWSLTTGTWDYGTAGRYHISPAQAVRTRNRIKDFVSSESLDLMNNAIDFIFKKVDLRNSGSVLFKKTKPSEFRETKGLIIDNSLQHIKEKLSAFDDYGASRGDRPELGGDMEAWIHTNFFNSGRSTWSSTILYEGLVNKYIGEAGFGDTWSASNRLEVFKVLFQTVKFARKLNVIKEISDDLAPIVEKIGKLSAEISEEVGSMLNYIEENSYWADLKADDDPAYRKLKTLAVTHERYIYRYAQLGLHKPSPEYTDALNKSILVSNNYIIPNLNKFYKNKISSTMFSWSIFAEEDGPGKPPSAIGETLLRRHYHNDSDYPESLFEKDEVFIRDLSHELGRMAEKDEDAHEDNLSEFIYGFMYWAVSTFAQRGEDAARFSMDIEQQIMDIKKVWPKRAPVPNDSYFSKGYLFRDKNERAMYPEVSRPVSFDQKEVAEQLTKDYWIEYYENMNEPDYDSIEIEPEEIESEEVSDSGRSQSAFPGPDAAKLDEYYAQYEDFPDSSEEESEEEHEENQDLESKSRFSEIGRILKLSET